MHSKQIAIEIKSFEPDDQQGVFTGMASTYGNVDLDGDIIEPGAFGRALSAKGDSYPLLYQHDHSAPIGLIKISETQQGLVAAGELNLEVQAAREARALMRQGALRSMSVGFMIQDYEINRDAGKGYRRLIKQAELLEVSIVTFPANQQALVASVKALTKEDEGRVAIKSVRDFERWLRDAGWSKRQATGLASHGWKAIGEIPVEEPTTQLTQILEKHLNELRNTPTQ